MVRKVGIALSLPCMRMEEDGTGCLLAAAAERVDLDMVQVSVFASVGRR